MRKVAVVNLDRACKDFKISVEENFYSWVKDLTKANVPLVFEGNTPRDFPVEIGYPVSQTIYGMRLNETDYIKIKVKIIPPPEKYSVLPNKIDSAESGTLDRGVIVLGFRENFTLVPMINMPGMGGTTLSKMIFPESCIHFFNGSGSGFDLIYDDSNKMARPERKGYRSGITEKKDPRKRFIIIIDVTPSDQRLQETLNMVQSAVMPKKRDEMDDLIDSLS